MSAERITVYINESYDDGESTFNVTTSLGAAFSFYDFATEHANEIAAMLRSKGFTVAIDDARDPNDDEKAA